MTRLAALFLALSVALATYASLAQATVARGTCPSMQTQQMPVCMIVGDQAVSVTKKVALKCLDLFPPPGAAETAGRASDPCPPEGVLLTATGLPAMLWRPPRA